MGSKPFLYRQKSPFLRPVHSSLIIALELGGYIKKEAQYVLANGHRMYMEGKEP